MKIYHYDPTTLDFIATGLADSSPLEEGVFLLPAFAIEITPPTFDPVTHACRFIDGGWSVYELPPVVTESVPAPKTLAEIQNDLCTLIDAAADSARLTIAGDPLRVVEYQRAETEAKAFAAAGYTGTTPPSIASWAEAKGWTGQVAADDILRASTEWNAALYAFRDIRLKGKEAVKAAAPADAQAAADAVIAQIQALLAQVQ